MKRFLQSMAKSLAYRLGFSLKKLRARPSVVGGATTGSGLGARVRPKLHRRDPYDGLPYADYPDDPSGWGGDSAAFEEVIEEIRPARVIEVGTWKGASALTMARAIRRLGLVETEIVCVDTWLGALEFWTDLDDPTRHRALELEFGYPTVYRRFLANVRHAGFQDMITPFPLPSATAARWFSLNGIRAGLIYLDGSHEEEDVYEDLASYWDLLLPGGRMLGDDWSWDGVRMAVERFAREERLPIRHRHDKWELARPS